VEVNPFPGTVENNHFRDTKTPSLMKKHLNSFAKLAACIILMAGAFSQTQADDKKPDPTGTWTWSIPGQNGGDARTVKLTLKAADDKLTGTMSGGRAGSEPAEIEDGKIKKDEVSFKVSREVNGTKIVRKYKGKLDGDTITGKVEFERNGESQSRDWEAKREAAAAK